MKSVVRSIIVLTTLAVGGCTALYALSASWVINAAYGPRYAPYIDIAPIVALQVFVGCLDSLPVIQLRITKGTRRMFFARLLLTPLGLAACWLSSANFGLAGAALGTVAVVGAQAVGAWLGLAAEGRHHRPNPDAPVGH